MKALLKTVFEGGRLPRHDARAAMELILSGEVKPEQVAALLGALSVRGESAEELAGFLAVLRERAVKVPTARGDLFDPCGTGGDNAGTFNISTAAGFVLAGAGIAVAKHGNRSVSSRCGSADVLEALGIKIDESPETTAKRIDDYGFGFLYAPLYHPALAKVAPIRRALEVRTVFNKLGPLANPARVTRQVMGIYDGRLIAQFAELLRDAGTVEAMVVAAEDGLDEFSIATPTRVAHLKDGRVTELTLAPEDFGLARASLERLRGGDAAENARIIERVLTGAERGPVRDVVVLNAAAGLVVAGRAEDFKGAASLAARAIDDGSAAGVLAKAGGRHG